MCALGRAFRSENYLVLGLAGADAFDHVGLAVAGLAVQRRLIQPLRGAGYDHAGQVGPAKCRTCRVQRRDRDRLHETAVRTINRDPSAAVLRVPEIASGIDNRPIRVPALGAGVDVSFGLAYGPTMRRVKPLSPDLALVGVGEIGGGSIGGETDRIRDRD